MTEMKYLFLFLLLIIISCTNSDYKELSRDVEQSVDWDIGGARIVRTLGYVYDTNSYRNIVIYNSSWRLNTDRTNWINELQIVLDKDYKNAKRRVAGYKGPYLKLENKKNN